MERNVNVQSPTPRRSLDLACQDFDFDNFYTREHTENDDSEFEDFNFRVMMPVQDSQYESFSNLNDKIRDLLYQEGDVIKPREKTNFWKDLKYIFLRDQLLTYSKYQIKRLGKQLARELGIKTQKDEIKWVRDYNFEGNLYYTGFQINSSREGFGRVSYKKLEEKNGIKYEGEFRKNGPHKESCKIYYENGKVMFEGKMIEGTRVGFGRLYWDNGKVAYSGNWKNNFPNGDQILIKNKQDQIAYKGKSLGVQIDQYFRQPEKPKIRPVTK